MTESVDELVDRAQRLFWAGQAGARPLLETAVAQAPQHIAAQWFLFMCELVDGDLSAARARGELLLKLSPNNPVLILSHVRALAADGELEAARMIVARHLVRHDMAADRRSLMANHFIEAVLFNIIGQPDLSYEASRTMCRDNDVPLVDWSQTKYDGAGIRVSLKDVRAPVKNRDICIFGRGPSAKELEAHTDRLRGHDFVPFLINEFQAVTERILTKAGKQPGLLCMTTSGVMRKCADDLRALYASDGFLGLAVANAIYDELRNSAEDDLLPEDRRIITFDSSGAEIDLPTPRNPLAFPTINTLVHALGAAILLEPRRIFLFGFDGKTSGRTGERYYAEDDKASYMAVGWEDRMERWLAWDTLRFNQVTTCFINHLHLLHDIKYPLIYNVGPDSALTCFPRIGLDDYSALTEGDA